MNVNEFGNDRRTRVFNILLVVWFILFITTAAFLPVMSVVSKGPASDLLKTAFLVVGMTMLSLALLNVILMITGVVSMPDTPELEDWPWPVTLLAAFIYACLLVSSPVSHTADRLGTEAALAQLGVLLGVFMLPFIVLAIILPEIVRRYSSVYARKVKEWGYISAMLIGSGMWLRVSDKPLSIMLKEYGVVVVILVAYLLFVAARNTRRRRRTNAPG